MTAYLPPLVIDVRVRKPGSKGRRLWLPLFLLWPPLLLLLLPVVVIALLVDLALLVSGARYHHYTLLVVNSLKLLAEVRGTHVDALSDDSLVKVDIY
jgi:hypothetical protein